MTEYDVEMFGPGSPWGLSADEVLLAKRAIEGGMIDDVLARYRTASNDSLAVIALNAEVARRISGVVGRWIEFPPTRPNGAWDDPSWWHVSQALLRRHGSLTARVR